MRMKPLRPGEKEWHKALVVDRHDQQSYTVATSEGGTYRRNRVHLRKTQEPPPIIQQEDGSTLPSNLTSHKPSENPEAPPISTPQMKTPDKTDTHNPLEVNGNPPLATERPSRVQRPPERLKDYDYFLTMHGVKLIVELAIEVLTRAPKIKLTGAVCLHSKQLYFNDIY